MHRTGMAEGLKSGGPNIPVQNLRSMGFLAPLVIFVKRKNSKMRHLKKFMKLMQWKSIEPALVSRIFFRCLIFDCSNIGNCKKGKVKDKASKKIGKLMEV